MSVLEPRLAQPRCLQMACVPMALPGMQEAAEVSVLFADGAVVFNAAVYDTKFKNLQVSVYNPTTSSYLTSNAASATSRVG